MNEMKHIIPPKLVSNTTTLKTFTFWKVSLKLYNIRVPVYKKSSSHRWNENNPSTMTTIQLFTTNLTVSS